MATGTTVLCLTWLSCRGKRQPRSGSAEVDGHNRPRWLLGPLPWHEWVPGKKKIISANSPTLDFTTFGGREAAGARGSKGPQTEAPLSHSTGQDWGRSRPSSPTLLFER